MAPTPPTQDDLSSGSRDWLSWVFGLSAVLLIAMLLIDTRADDQVQAHAAVASGIEAKLRGLDPAFASCRLGPVHTDDFLLSCGTTLSPKVIESHWQHLLSLLGGGKLYWRRGHTVTLLGGSGAAGPSWELGDRAFFEQARRRQIRRE